MLTVLAVATRSDPRLSALLADAAALGFAGLEDAEIFDLYRFPAPLDPSARRALEELIVDRIAQSWSWDGPPEPPDIEVSYLPGVTDTVAEQLLAAAVRLGIAVAEATTGRRYRLRGSLTPAERERLAQLLLFNPTVQSLTLRQPGATSQLPKVHTLAVRGLDESGLLALSRQRRAALDAAEMRSMQSYFVDSGRDPTDAEFEMIAQTWSEHCCHKTFRAQIEVEGRGSVDGLLSTYLREATDKIAAPWVVSAFVDNAGLVELDGDWLVAVKVETHNHPSAIEPFGGANTGLGGVVRDVLGVSARPIAATDVLCFGPADATPPAGTLHPRRVRSGVVAGIQDYGNKLGVPIVNGAVRYHPGYLANPLVYCGCIGTLRRGQHPREVRPGDRVLVLGGRVGRDGLRGATFSSMAMESDSGTVAGASVQIGHPFVEKALIEVVCAARDLGLYHAITDCGAGGLSSAVGEMAEAMGVWLDLSRVPLKYAGLDPWEIWLSEAQERMVLACPESALTPLGELCERYGIELTDLGHFEATGKIRVVYGEQSVVELDCRFLQEGLPRRNLCARVAPVPAPEPSPRDLLAWLADANVASKEAIIRRYDHEVQGGSIVRPLVGVCQDGPSDAAVLRPQGYRGGHALVISNGLALCEHDAYAQAWGAVDEAVRNAVCVGADPDRLALLDNFCWGDPNRPETLGALVEACRACHDAALAYRAPFVSGKDSLNNEYVGDDGQRHAIPGTLLITCVGRLDHRDQAVTSDLKHPGNPLYLLEGELPALELYQAFHRAVRARLVRSAHDASEGGLAVTLAEMCIGGRLGASVVLSDPYAEKPGRIVAEVDAAHESEWRLLLPGAVHLGEVTEAAALDLNGESYPVASLVRAFSQGGWQ